MADSTEAPQTLSYAKIVDPAKEEEPKATPVVEKVTKTESEAAPVEKSKEVGTDDDEGFQQVTNKKVEKQKEKEIQREKELKKRRRNKPRKERFGNRDRDREKVKDKDLDKDKENIEIKHDSKEDSPSLTKTETEKEFVPAPPPKNNPWKKSSNKSDSNNQDSANSDKVKPKTDRKKKISEKDTKEFSAPAKSNSHHHSKQNPWKKVEANNEADVPSSPKVIKVEKKGGEGGVWPKLGEEGGGKPAKSGGGKRTKSGESGDSGAASSLETEEGRDNQVQQQTKDCDNNNRRVFIVTVFMFVILQHLWVRL